MQPFRDYLLGLIKRAGLTQASLSKQLGQERGVFVNNVVQRRRHPPLDGLSLGRWMKALKLNAFEREEFELRAIAEHLPDRQREFIEALWAEVCACRGRRRKAVGRRPRS